MKDAADMRIITTAIVTASVIGDSASVRHTMVYEKPGVSVDGLDKFDSGTRWPSFTTQGGGR